jgi:hypothetical protein
MQRLLFRFLAGTVLLWVLQAPNTAFAGQYWAIVDEYDRPTPGQGNYFHRVGGDRGQLNESEVSYAWNGDSAYAATVVSQAGSWSWGGMWYSLIHPNNDKLPLNFNAVFGPAILSAFQGRVTGIEIVIKGVTSPATNEGLVMRLELKDSAGNTFASWNSGGLTQKTYPYTWFIDLSSTPIADVQTLTWIMDGAKLNDAVTVDRIRLRVQSLDLATVEEAFLWSYAWLMGNYDPDTGMVRDRSNFKRYEAENVSATGKAAKLVAYAARKGYTSAADAQAIIVKIADTLLNKVPRGPAGVNALWPHFTKTGGTVTDPGTEWASGDTAYAALDLMVALQMIGDPQHQLAGVESFLTAIDWGALRRITCDRTISHGYNLDGSPILSGWGGYGMETVGVNWAYGAVTGQVTTMLGRPSDNGSGFIDNAHYPLVLAGLDGWGNNWDVYRADQAAKQVSWYTQAKNRFLSADGLFGLSAAESPEGGVYVAYGIGGVTASEDGSGEVVVPHYAGMIADLRPAESKRMWETLRQSGDLSPLNNVESMGVNATTGRRTVNPLKGSWNLALQAEGWAMADPAIRPAVANAVQQNAFLRRGAEIAGGGTTGKAAAALTHPISESELPGVSATFSWTAGAGASKYRLDVGNAPGTAEHAGGETTATSRTVTGLPCDGRTLYVSLYTYYTGAADWQRPPRQYTFRAASDCSAPATLAPAASCGTGQILTSTFTNPGGYQTLDVVNVLINDALDGRRACYLAYSRPSNALYIVDDNGDAARISGKVMDGTGTLGNSQCTVSLAGSSATGNGNTLTLSLDVSFASSFAGNRVVYTAARDLSRNNSGWRTMGVYGVRPLPSAFPRPVGLTPSWGNSLSQTITFTYQDQSAASNLQTVWALVNTAIDGRQACYVAYYRPGNLLYLYPDNGDGSQATNIALTGTNSIGNSQCTVSAQGAKVRANGNTLSVTLPVAFKTSFAGFKGVWLAAQTLNAAKTSAWQALGAEIVPSQ